MGRKIGSNPMPDKLVECLEKVAAEHDSAMGPVALGSEDYRKTKNALAQAILAEGTFSIFDKHLQYLGNSGSITSLYDFTDWLIERALQVGAAQAAGEARTYSTSTEVEVFEVLLLADTYSNPRSFQFSNGVVFAMPEALPMRGFAEGCIGREFWSPMPLPKVVGVLFKGFNQPVKHTPSVRDAVENEEADLGPIDTPLDNLMDVARCLTLSRKPRFGVHKIAHGTVAPDDMPFLRKSGSWSLHAFRQPALTPLIREVEFKRADQILTRYALLEESQKKKLNIPIDYINKFASVDSQVDRAISLRVCLDSLFGEDVPSELVFRISLRAANFLGSSNLEKQEIFRLIKKTYHVTSGAVHDGVLRDKADIDEMMEVAILAQKAVIKIIEHGGVNWSEIELGLVEE